MKVTTNHPKSHRGIPVVLDDEGKVIPHHRAIKLVIERASITPAQFALGAGISLSAVNAYLYRNAKIPARVMNVLGSIVDALNTNPTPEILTEVLRIPPPDAVEKQILKLHESGLSCAAIAQIVKVDGKTVSRARIHQLLQQGKGKSAC